MAVVDQISLFTSPPKKTDQYNNRKMDLIEVLEIDDLGGDVAPPWARPLCTHCAANLTHQSEDDGGGKQE